jgi:hypothetical protein
MRPRRGAPPEEWDAWLDSIEQTDETGLPAARRAMAKPVVYDALSEEIDRSPIVRYMSGAGAGLEAGEPPVPSWPVIQEND